MNIKNALIISLCTAGVLAGCSKSESGSEATQKAGNYIISVLPVSATGVADYLYTTSSLDTGSITTKKTGIEQDGSYRSYVTTNNKLFSLLYGQGNPGAVTTYNIVDGKLNKLSNFQTESVQAYTPVDKDLLLFKISRNLNSPTSTWYKVNTDELLIKSEGTTNTLQLASNGELAFFSWIKQVGNKVYAPYFCIQDRSFSTKYPDSTWIAVFNYADMKLEKVIKDNRTGTLGGYFLDALSLEENGDVYGFSPARSANGKNPSAIVKVKSGTTEFDKSYFYNFEQASNGGNIRNWLYVGNHNYVVMYTSKDDKSSYDANRIAIINTVDKTFKNVSGFPEGSLIKVISTYNYSPKDGKTGYIGVNMKDATQYVWKVDASTATAVRGLKVLEGSISAINHL